ncbi:rhodanese domain protein [Cyanobium sp. PCC 7001]|uniref:oxygen-dependent tRNA uridine(34) hydroxylase TrhO n=1 Tax=Cyanobium sp. PCC 7001 TaxID=180281 RepID=UPI000180504C|nr:rhodanese-related sulfurtransferase [Cyanobium sp. PCC 7001]EDY39388.1 rhodanese domain protein [Cyanobium sp. PCC 7001]
MSLRVAAFYRFAPFAAAELPSLRRRLLACGEEAGVKGSVLLAPEGVNGTVSGPEAGVEALLQELRADPRLAALREKRAAAPVQPFHRFKVRLKREIVTMGDPALQPYLATAVGAHVDPQEWDALITDPRTLVIDTRNAYEVALGRFEGAIDPGTTSFREFPAWVERELKPLVDQQRPEAIALYCTGGIRCEKATAHLLQQGFEAVHHLHGGILRYLEERPQAGSRWQGECFVFDQRVAVNHRLEPGEARLCHACRRPLTPADRQLPSYVEGVSCRHCEGQRGPLDRARFAERQKQMALARRRGEAHLGRAFPQR